MLFSKKATGFCVFPWRQTVAEPVAPSARMHVGASGFPNGASRRALPPPGARTVVGARYVVAPRSGLRNLRHPAAFAAPPVPAADAAFSLLRSPCGTNPARRADFPPQRLCRFFARPFCKKAASPRRSATVCIRPPPRAAAPRVSSVSPARRRTVPISPPRGARPATIIPAPDNLCLARRPDRGGGTHYVVAPRSGLCILRHPAASAAPPVPAAGAAFSLPLRPCGTNPARRADFPPQRLCRFFARPFCKKAASPRRSAPYASVSPAPQRAVSHPSPRAAAHRTDPPSRQRSCPRLLHHPAAPAAPSARSACRLPLGQFNSG